MLRYCVVQKNILRRNIRPLFASESGERYSANVSKLDPEQGKVELFCRDGIN
jgi:hypothetical protein